MASAFNLTAQLNLRGPSNVSAIVSNIRRQLGTISANVNVNINPTTTRNVAQLSASLNNLNRTFGTTTTSANNAARALQNFGNSVAQFSNNIRNVPQQINNTTSSIARLNAAMTSSRAASAAAGTEMQEFGRQAGLAARRFAAISTVTSVIFGLTSAIKAGVQAFIDYDREFIKLQQVTGESATGLKGLSDTIGSLSTGLGVSSKELVDVSSTLAQAGLSARDTEKALKALALSALAPSFDDMNKTVEGSIALMRQFGISAGDLDKALGSVNAVAAKFAVEASDIITAIQRTGGVFATASKGVSEGTDALNEFISVFTSVRATTRESAETIATGLRTIFTRIQRGDTIEALKEYGVNLQDLDGKFVGAFKAVQLLSQGLSKLDPRDLSFSKIVEELGGFRQIGKVIPLIQQFATAQDALKVAQAGQGSLAADAAKAQQSLANQISKVREEFLSLFREIGSSDGFQTIIKGALTLTSTLIKVADSVKGILPALAAMLAFKGASSLVQFGAGFVGAVRGQRRAEGGPIRRFAAGGLVPGSGNADSINARLTPGEFVMRKQAVRSIGVDNLNRANGGFIPKGYARGTEVKKKQELPTSSATHFTHLDARLGPDSFSPRLRQYLQKRKLSVSGIYSNMGLDLPQSWNSNWAKEPDLQGVLSSKLAGYIRSKDVFKTLKSGSKKYRFTGQGTSIAQQLLNDNYPAIQQELANNVASYPAFYDTDARDVSKIMPSLLSKSIKNVLSKKDASNLIKGFEEKSVYKLANVAGRKKTTQEMRQNLATGGLIRKFSTAGLVTPSTANASEILKVLTLEGAMNASGASAGEIQKILRKRNTLSPTEQNIKDKILGAYTKKTSGIKSANDTDIQKAITNGLLFGAAGFKGRAFPTTPRMDIPGLKNPISVRITSGVLDSEMSKKLLKKMSGGLNDIANKASRNMMIKDILKQTGPIYADFDRTLAFGADKILADPRKPKYSEFSDRNKVQGALGKAKLSALGSAIVSTIKQAPEFANNLNIISARPQSTMDLVAGWLAQKGIPIPLSRIKGVGGENVTAEQIAVLKADLMNPEGAFVDDDDRNIAEAEKRGIRSYLYKKKNVGATSRKKLGEANAQGYLAERIIHELGGPIVNKAATNYGIDFPDGLQSAAKYFNLPSNIPTDAKLTLNGPAELKGQIGNYLKARGYASGGHVQAMVSAGEAFVPPEEARQIGYGKLREMNQADRNGMSSFSSGGISVFKGPGTGTSDSIGPVSLPVGGFVIREKATKALGLRSGGSIGRVQGFLTGGTIETASDTLLNSNPNAMGVSTRSLDTRLNIPTAQLNELNTALRTSGINLTQFGRLITRGGDVSVAAAKRAIEADIRHSTALGTSVVSTTQLAEATEILTRVQNVESAAANNRTNTRQARTADRIANIGDRINNTPVLGGASRFFGGVGNGLNGQGGFIASMAVGALAGQGENLFGKKDSSASAARKNARLESGATALSTGLGLASSVAMIPGVGPALAGVIAVGTALGVAVDAVYDFSGAALKAEQEFNQGQRTKNIEDIGEKLGKSMEAYQKNPSGAKERAEVVSLSLQQTRAITDDSSQKLADLEASNKKGFFNAVGFTKPKEITDDEKLKIATASAKQADPAADAARKVIEQRIDSGERFSDITRGSEFKKLSEVIASANPEFVAARNEIMAMTDAQIAQKGQTKEQLIAEKLKTESSKLASDAYFVAKEKTAAAAKAMEEADKAGRQLAQSFQRMVNTFNQALGKVVFNLEKMDNASQANIAALNGNAKVSKVVSKNLSVLSNPRAYSQNERDTAYSNVSSPFGQDKDSVRQLLNLDSENLGFSVRNNINSSLKDKAGLTLDRAASSSRNNLEKEISNLPEVVRSEILGKFDAIKGQVAADPNLKTDEQRVNKLAERLEEELGKAASESAQNVRNMAIEFEKARVGALNNFIDSINDAAEAQSKAQKAMTSARETRTSGADALNEALGGRPVSVATLQARQNVNIGGLTGGITDPVKIRESIERKNAQRSKLEEQRQKLSESRGNNDAGVIQLSRQIAGLNTEINNSSDALGQLANNTEVASAAMNKIKDIQQQMSAQGDFLDRLATSTPEEAEKLGKTFQRLQNNLAGGLNDARGSQAAQEAYSNALQSGSSPDQARMAGDAVLAQERAEVLALFKDLKPVMSASGRSDAEINAMQGTLREGVYTESGLLNNPMLGRIAQGQINYDRNPLSNPALREAAGQYAAANENKAVAQEQEGIVQLVIAAKTMSDAADRFKEATEQFAKIFQNMRDADRADQPQQQQVPPGGPAQPQPQRPVNPQRRANGGLIYASAGTLVNFEPKGTDTIPAMLTRGEYVINAKSTSENLDLLEAINSGEKIQYKSKGGKVQYHANGNGPINASREFALLDKNKDGILDAKEAGEYIKFDNNKDKRITISEFNSQFMADKEEENNRVNRSLSVFRSREHSRNEAFRRGVPESQVRYERRALFAESKPAKPTAVPRAAMDQAPPKENPTDNVPPKPDAPAPAAPVAPKPVATAPAAPTVTPPSREEAAVRRAEKIEREKALAANQGKRDEARAIDEGAEPTTDWGRKYQAQQQARRQKIEQGLAEEQRQKDADMAARKEADRKRREAEDKDPEVLKQRADRDARAKEKGDTAKADAAQWAKDNPEEAGKLLTTNPKTGSVSPAKDRPTTGDSYTDKLRYRAAVDAHYQRQRQQQEEKEQQDADQKEKDSLNRAFTSGEKEYDRKEAERVRQAQEARDAEAERQYLATPEGQERARKSQEQVEQQNLEAFRTRKQKEKDDNEAERARTGGLTQKDLEEVRKTNQENLSYAGEVAGGFFEGLTNNPMTRVLSGVGSAGRYAVQTGAVALTTAASRAADLQTRTMDNYGSLGSSSDNKPLDINSPTHQAYYDSLGKLQGASAAGLQAGVVETAGGLTSYVDEGTGNQLLNYSDRLNAQRQGLEDQYLEGADETTRRTYSYANEAANYTLDPTLTAGAGVVAKGAGRAVDAVDAADTARRAADNALNARQVAQREAQESAARSAAISAEKTRRAEESADAARRAKADSTPPIVTDGGPPQVHGEDFYVNPGEAEQAAVMKKAADEAAARTAARTAEKEAAEKASRQAETKYPIKNPSQEFKDAYDKAAAEAAAREASRPKPQTVTNNQPDLDKPLDDYSKIKGNDPAAPAPATPTTKPRYDLDAAVRQDKFGTTPTKDQTGQVASQRAMEGTAPTAPTYPATPTTSTYPTTTPIVKPTVRPFSRRAGELALVGGATSAATYFGDTMGSRLFTPETEVGGGLPPLPNAPPQPAFMQNRVPMGQGEVERGGDDLPGANEEDLDRKKKNAQPKSLGGLIYASNGALISAKKSGTDRHLAMLSDNEYVVNNKDSLKHRGLLDAINSGNYSRGGIVNYMANGGVVGAKYYQKAGLVDHSGNVPSGGSGVSNNSQMSADALSSVVDKFGEHVNNMTPAISQFGEHVGQVSPALMSFGGMVGTFGGHVEAMSAGGTVVHTHSVENNHRFIGGESINNVLNTMGDGIKIAADNRMQETFKNVDTYNENSLLRGTDSQSIMGKNNNIA
jgi:TP901 family phage tail tape measure protein